MNSKRHVRGKFGHVLQVDVCRFRKLNSKVVYHLQKNSGNFGLEFSVGNNGTCRVVFRIVAPR